MGFPRDSVVEVRQHGDSDWEVKVSLVYEAAGRRRYTARPGMLTDFASVPRVFVWLLPRYGRYTKAAIIHDHLWHDVVRSGELTLREADALFRTAMAELGVAFLRRWLMWGAVRIGALTKERPGWDWAKTAPAILVLGVIGLIVAGPPAALIIVALVLFLMLEAITWGVLRAARAVANSLRPHRKPAVPINAPSLTWRL